MVALASLFLLLIFHFLIRNTIIVFSSVFVFIEMDCYFGMVGSGGEMMMKEGNTGQSVNINSNNAETIGEPDGDVYYSQYLQATEGAGCSLQKDVAAENGCGFSGRKDSSFSIESGESLRAIFSDPVT